MYREEVIWGADVDVTQADSTQRNLVSRDIATDSVLHDIVDPQGLQLFYRDRVRYMQHAINYEHRKYSSNINMTLSRLSASISISVSYISMLYILLYTSLSSISDYIV